MRDSQQNYYNNYDTSGLPSLPHILIKLLNSCMDENVCFDAIANIIRSDASLTAKVISAANSPIYGHASQLTSLKHTLMFLGLETIKSIAITASVQQFFSKYDAKKGQQLAHFWSHTLLTALIAKSLAQMVNYHAPDEAYLAALLHDIGKLVFQLDKNCDYQALLEGVEDFGEQIKLEQEQFHLSHDELGSHLLSEWGLSSFISDAVRYHHAADDQIQDAHLLVKIINMANKASSLAPGEVFDDVLFDLSSSVIADIVQVAREQSSNVARSMGIDISDTQDFDNKQIELARHVKAVALSQSNAYRPQSDLQANISYSCQLLFGISKSCLFIYDSEKNHLFLDYPTADINIPLESKSIISQCLVDACISTSFTKELPIVDRQIVSLLAADGFICLPLFDSAVKYGVLLLAVADGKWQPLLENSFQLKLFSRQIMQSYIQNKQELQSKLDLENTIRSEFELKAREIVHETNNPLSIINNYLQLLSNKLSGDSEIKNELSVIQSEIQRVGNIIIRCTEQVTTYVDHNNEADINEMINQLIGLYRASLFMKNNTKCKLLLASSLPGLKVNVSHLKQVITNIIKNAVEAMKNDGEVIIATNKINVNGKDFISILIKDNGPGMPESIYANMYKPVQTTKDSSHSGLGLSIVKSMLDKCQGTITCNTSSKGTEFTLLIPIK